MTTRRSLLGAVATAAVGGILVNSSPASAESGMQTTLPGGKVALEAPQPIKASNEPVLATLATALNSQYDSINVDRMGKGSVITALSAISETTTSSELDCRGFNGLLLHVTINGTGTWAVSLQNAMHSGGRFVDAYDGTVQLTTGKLSSDRCVLLRGVSDWVKVVAVKAEGGATCTVLVQPVNV